ncbi:hypothetical protein T06_1001 [Trichinella sp. T6]|nr:hypothetical protein T06_1001 [Trichinella sp. T6]
MYFQLTISKLLPLVGFPTYENFQTYVVLSLLIEFSSAFLLLILWLRFKEWSKENVKTRTARSRTREGNSIRDIW